MRKRIIGMGPGRCGTRSLAKLIDSHPLLSCSHEKQYQLWDVDTQRADRFLSKMSDMSGDVGFYWINYVDHIRAKHPNTKFICLLRDKKDVIASYMRNQVSPIYSNFLMNIASQEGKVQRLCDRVTQEELDAMDYYTREWVETYWDEPMINERMMEEFFPKYGIKDKEDYLSQYYDDYYKKAYLYAKDPGYIIFDMNYVLNTTAGKEQLFNFIGVSPVFESFHIKDAGIAVTIGGVHGRR